MVIVFAFCQLVSFVSIFELSLIVVVVVVVVVVRVVVVLVPHRSN